MADSKSLIPFYSSFYNDENGLRAAIMAIPIIGGQLDLLLSSPGQKFVEERLRYLIDELQNEMSAVQEHLINKDFIGKEEGFDLIQKTFIATAKTRQREKLKVFAQILRGGLTLKEKTHDPELYLRIVDELTVKELEVALLLYEVKEIRKIIIEEKRENQHGMTNDPYWFSKHYTQYSRDELEYILPRIANTGLIKEFVGSAIGNGGWQYNPTPLFKDFISFIENNE